MYCIFCIQTHLTLKEEHIEPLPCQIKREMQVEETLLNDVPGEEAVWSKGRMTSTYIEIFFEHKYAWP